MADKKILAAKHIDRIKKKFIDRAELPGAFEQPQNADPVGTAKAQDFAEEKIAAMSGYRMKDLYPDTYQTMTSIPTDIDYSKLVRADRLFEGCAALQSVNGLDLSSAISASHLFDGCTSLTSVKGLITPNVADFEMAFSECTHLSELEEFDTSKCHNFYAMFMGCESLPEKFPWTLNMMSVAHLRDKNHGKLMFHCSSVKELDCYLTYPTEISISRDQTIEMPNWRKSTDPNADLGVTSKGLLAYIWKHPESIGTTVRASREPYEWCLDGMHVYHALSMAFWDTTKSSWDMGTFYQIDDKDTLSLKLDADIFSDIVSIVEIHRREQLIGLALSLKPESGVAAELVPCGKLVQLDKVEGTTYVTGQDHRDLVATFKNYEYKMRQPNFKINILGE